VRCNGRIFRFVRAAGIADLRQSLASPGVRHFREAGQIVSTRELETAEVKSLRNEGGFEDVYASEQWGAVLEHELIPFPSYPHEWPPEMLYEAGRLTLELARTLLDERLGLKDATPYNILFRGPTPVFTDLLSLERRGPTDAIWLPYAQFMRTFVLPLLASKHFGLSLQRVFRGSREGLEPEDVYRLASIARRLRPAFFVSVTLPTLMAQRGLPGDSRPKPRTRRASTAEEARFTLGGLLAHLGRALDAARPRVQRTSRWAGYTGSDSSVHPEAYHAGKRNFVDAFCAEHRVERVLDVGCNDGHMSVIAARRGARVVAIDSDPTMVGEVWRKAAADRLDILSLVVDLTDPTPATGWRNAEFSSFLTRATKHFDAVFFLAVLHHLLVTGGVPLEEVVALAAELTTAFAIIEYVPPDDPMFRHLARGRDAQYASLTRAAFESCCRRHFDVVKSQDTDTGRVFYLLRKVVQ
jgi:hypothetical protein